MNSDSKYYYLPSSPLDNGSTLTEDLNSVPNTGAGQLTTTFNSGSRREATSSPASDGRKQVPINTWHVHCTHKINK